MKITIDEGSAFWVSEDLKVTLVEAWDDLPLFVFGFPRMNEVDVGEVVLFALGPLSTIENDAIPLPKGIYGRSIVFMLGGDVRIPKLGVTLTLLASESGRKRATLEVEIDPSSPMKMI